MKQYYITSPASMSKRKPLFLSRETSDGIPMYLLSSDKNKIHFFDTYEMALEVSEGFKLLHAGLKARINEITKR